LTDIWWCVSLSFYGTIRHLVVTDVVEMKGIRIIHRRNKTNRMNIL